jgi:hypothetical protein
LRNPFAISPWRQDAGAATPSKPFEGAPISASTIAGQRAYCGLFLLVYLLLTLRWGPIAVPPDFGFLHEAADRILQGDVLNRDMFYTLPPLPPYLVAAVYGVLGSHLLWHQLLAYLAWGLNLLSGVLLARQLGGRADAIGLGLILGLTMGLPAALWTIVYNDLSVACLVLGIATILPAVGSGQGLWRSCLAGALFGLTVGIRQNLGLGFALLMLPGLPLLFWLAFGWRRALAHGATLAGGMAIGLLPLAALLLPYHSLGSLWQDLVVGAAEGKGGVLTTLLRGLPRPIIETWDPSLARRAVELGVGALLVLLGLWALLRHAHRHPGPAPHDRVRLWPLWLFLALSLVALVPCEALPETFNAAAAFVGQTSLTAFLFSITHIALCALLLALAWHLVQSGMQAALFDPRRRMELFVVLCCAAIAVGQATSRAYLVGSVLAGTAPAVLCLAADRLGLRPRSLRLPAAVAALILIVSPGTLVTFERLKPIAAGPAFEGLWANPGAASFYASLWNDVRPLVAGRRTLWLAINGPWTAFGGLSVPSSLAVYAHAHRREHEEILFARWLADPPERIVRMPTVPIHDSYWAEGNRLELWIGGHYAKLWEGGTTSVWGFCDSPPGACPD